eukprot:g15182.t1
MGGDAMTTTTVAAAAAAAAAAANDCCSNGGARETTARGGDRDAYVNNNGTSNCSHSGDNSMGVGGTRGWAGAGAGGDDRLG